MRPFCVATEWLVPVRREPAHASEMVNQLLFGEGAEVLETTPDGTWTYIKGAEDGYEGWVSTGMFSQCETRPTLARLGPFETVLARPKQGGANWGMQTSPGSRFPVFSPVSQESTLWFDTPEATYEVFSGALLPDDTMRTTPLAEAMRFLGVPYLWGGRSAWGIDCSGLMLIAFGLNNISLPRDAYQQAECGTAVSWPSRQSGHLAFFANVAGRITHVGILAENGQILHASGEGRVRLDTLTERGICHTHTGELTHPLAFLRQV